MSNKRVVITGIGAVTPVGIGKEQFWQGIRKEESGLNFISRFDTSRLNAKCAGEIRDFDPAEYFPPHKLKRLDRYAQFSLAIAKLALEDSGLEASPENPTFDYGVSFGTALGGVTTAEIHHERFLKEGRIPPALALQVFGGSAHSNIAISYGLRGYGTTNSNSCASGTVSVGEAFRTIRDGKVEAVVAGAAEAPLAPLTYGAFDTIKTMSTESEDPRKACRPFDNSRTGFVMGEGGAGFVCESLEHAKARGAHIYAEVLGYDLNNDAYHMTSSLPGGASAIRAMSQSLKMAGIKPEEVSYINAHASSTAMNDDSETEAILQLFGDKTPPVSGTKAYYGHPLGASAAIEIAISCLAMENDWIPPTLNCNDPCVPDGFDLVRLTGRKAELKYVLSNSFGFGGINSTIVLGRPPEN